MRRPLPLILLIALPWASMSQDIFQAIADGGASKFAQLIQSDPETKAVYTSGRVRTVFAPADVPSLRRRSPSLEEQQKAALHASNEVGDTRSYRTLPGKKVITLDTSANLAGLAQSVVTDARQNTAGLFKVASGLGATVNVIRGDIPFTGGLIHIVDNYFTIPQLLSSTCQITGQTTFASLLSSANLTNSLDNAPLTTFFVPSNAALAAAGISAPGPETAAILAEHVVTNAAAYLPDLQDGLALKNQNGNALTISVKAGEYFVGNAKIVRANQILANGVAHVIDKVLTRPSSSPAP